jgi:hypothetical protein
MLAEALAEIIKRAMAQGSNPDNEAYMAIFVANVPLPGASNLIFWSIQSSSWVRQRRWRASQPVICRMIQGLQPSST